MSSPAHMPACDVCRGIKATLSEPGRRINLGSFDALLQRPCPGHESLMKFLAQKQIRAWSKDEDTRELNLVLFSDIGGGGTFEFQQHLVDKFSQDVLLFSSDDEIQITGSGRALDSDWVDTELLRGWIGECLTKHGSTCCNPLNISKTSPAWLIDTVQNCLVPGDGIYDFFALSYTWGIRSTSWTSQIFRWRNRGQLETRRDILDALQKPGSLSRSPFVTRLSPAIRDAAGLVRLLGERYLWADALCIVQDDGEQTAEQLRLMGAIYATAKVTIVAADGDANHGIPGLRGVSKSRNLHQNIFPLGQHDQIIIREKPILRHVRDCSRYFERAWTFQEYVLSTRCLIIGSNQFHWICPSTSFHEDMRGPDTESHTNSSLYKFPLLSGERGFNALDTVISEYNSRDLSFSEDALPGIAGLLRVMSRSFPGGFLYGLPEMLFEAALMWFSVFPPTVSRRTHSGKKHSILEGSTLPSWSWLGWRGILFHVSRGENNWELFNKGHFTVGITQWFGHDTPSSKNKRAIQSTFLDHQDGSLEGQESEVLTSGWTRETFDPQKHAGFEVELDTSASGTSESDGNEIDQRESASSEIEESESGGSDSNDREPWVNRLDTRRYDKIMERKKLYVFGKHVYQHPDLPHRLFWRPVPVENSADDSEMSMPLQHPFISCETRRGRFFVMPFPKEQPAEKGLFSYSQLEVFDKSEKICGYIQPDESEGDYGGHGKLSVTSDGMVLSSGGVKDPDSGPRKILITRDLVAVCLQRKPEGGASVLHGKFGAEIIEDPQYTERYGVLWVEWVDGVAYRKGFGYIQKESWEAHDLEDVHLVLG